MISVSTRYKEKKKGYCDNVDCKTTSQVVLFDILLEDEFYDEIELEEEGPLRWCIYCIDRDSNMIKQVLNPDYYNQGESELEIARFCPICNNRLNLGEYMQTTKEYDFFHSTKIWTDSKVAIPCCNCFLLLKILKEENIIYYNRNDNYYYIPREGQSPVFINIREFEVLDSFLDIIIVEP